MIKKQQKWIALLVTLTFMGLLQVSTMPLAAANAAEQISSANTEQAPNFIEEEGDSSYQTKKKSIMPVILIGVGVAAVAAVLFLVVLKTKYDITGAWTITWKYSGYSQMSNTITYTGDKKSGTFMIGSATGTYSVDKKNVQWTYAGGTTTYTGAFTDKNNMSGTMISSGTPGTWSAVKKATTTSIGNIAAADKNATGEVQN